MALPSIHNVTGHTTQQTTAKPNGHADKERNFRPNPDAKPFIPNPLAVVGTNWHFYPNESTENINGVIPPFINRGLDHGNLMIPGANSLKKHIAFHLVSNVLDDEVLEEKEQHFNKNNHPLMITPELNMYEANELVNTWKTPISSNFVLPLDVERSSSDKSSINNKSIHEIWSPDASPNGLNNLSPNDELFIQHPQQLLDSPNSVVDSQDTLFEQVPNDIAPQQLPPTNGMQMYSSGESGSNEENCYCYQNLPSPVYPQYNYRPQQQQRQGLDYPSIVPPRNNLVISKIPMVVESNNFYDNQYISRCHHYGREISKDLRNSCHGKQQQIMYDLAMGCVEELGINLDECRDQLRHLERGCKKADTNLAHYFRLQKTPLNEVGQGKFPPNSTRVDKLIIHQQREHQKVELLIGRIERLGFTPMHPNVGVALDLWLAAIKDLRNVRKGELANISDTQQSMYGGSKSHAQTDVRNLIASVKTLTKSTRSARTIVWCAMQMLLANNINCSPGVE